ncbi:MAG: DEAD/DEAH box helicase family protein, partial [Maritimibacter sp.]|nr:DEAD/DEAH box helicase family protein [Maritimibacter sp.]
MASPPPPPTPRRPSGPADGGWRMIPRDYQKAAVAAARDRLATHGNTLLVLPTGAGKTAIAGFCIGEELEHRRQDRVLVLQHTDELIEQNRGAIGSITGLPTSVVKAE